MKYFILATLFLTVISCSESTETYQDPITYLADFPQGSGSYWVYAYYDSLTSTADTVTVSIENHTAENTKLWKYTYTDHTDSLYVKTSGDTLKMSQDSAVEFPRTVIIFPLEKGKSWMHYIYTDSVSAVQDINVLGESKDAFILNENWGAFNDYGQIKRWIVPNLGIVKIRHTGWSFGTANNTWDLLDYHIQEN
ncbi:MAG: hypothetical protein KDF60_09110 [Calditrichaeota bacterium]|nr:hypothetical protein [Calditrichota bacterium]